MEKRKKIRQERVAKKDKTSKEIYAIGVRAIIQDMAT